ncbi:MAG: hypothetical protein ACKPKO_22985, partial [Candidatus Fonsibacter sp.]
KKIREAVYNILNQILEIGRHFKIHCIVTNHLPTNGKDTRRILNEAHTITYFPHSAGGKIKYLLEGYVGLDRKQIAYMKRQRSRACTIFKNYPQCYLLQNEIVLLDLDHDDEQQPERACCLVTGLYDRQYHKVSVRLLNQQQLAAREQSSLILIQSVIRVS